MDSGRGERNRGATPLALIERERELLAVEEFLEPARAGVAALVLDGPAGIGKTSVWDAALSAVERDGSRVLRARCAPQESGLGFLGLSDLLREVEPERLSTLPRPQREALEAALLLNRDDARVDERSVFTGTLELLRRIGDEETLVVGIDDWSWLDAATAAALAFAARRLAATPVRFLLTERVPPSTTARHPLQETLDPERMTLGALSSAGIGRLLHLRQGLPPSWPQARRLNELAAGNPMIALELGRAIARQADPLSDGPIRLTERLETLVGEGIEALSAAVRRALLAVALSPAVTVTELTAFVGEDTVEESLRLGVLTVDTGRVRPVHPLLGEVVKDRSRASERRELHAALAVAIADVERRALHLAAAATGPDAVLAREIGDAAEHAARRAAILAAAELAERALELTPATDPEYETRLLAAADFMRRAGELKRVAKLLGPSIPRMRPGVQRGHARFLLADAVDDGVEGLEQALEEVKGESVLRSRILRVLAERVVMGGCERLADAERLGHESLTIARRCGDAAATSEALAMLSWVRSLRGRPIDDLVASGRDTPADIPLHYGLERITAVASMWRGQLDEARGPLRHLLDRAVERGEGEAYFALRVQLCELELRAGRWDIVETILEEWAREEGEMVGHSAALLRCRALVRAGRGDADGALVHAREALAAAQPPGRMWHRLESLRALGLAGLLSGDLAMASASFGEVWNHTRTEAIDNPGAFPVAADLVEALVLAGSLPAADEATRELSRLASAQGHPWARAACARARGHVASGNHDDETALACFAEAAAGFAELGFPLDQARALTGLGATQRRLRRKRDARASLESALSILGELGSPGWADHTQRGLDRVGGRVPSGDALTPTERQVAELVAQGLANKQVAAALVVSIGAVEAHLTRIYAKLGVRSRTGLARTLGP